tara:strand:+ start:18855 stop:19082 length:228 start_codon:yes stop_codon:yes gene_type:complete
LTEDVYNSILKGQDYKCKICGKSHTEDNKLHVDHHEKYGRDCIAGLLCGLCNSMIAHARHDKETLKKAIDYLENI